MAFYSQGIRLFYVPWAIIPSKNLYLLRGFFFIIPPKRSAPPF